MSKIPEQQQPAAATSTHELDRLVQTRTLELSALSSHLQSLAEKEKSGLARTLHDELGGLLTAAKMDLSWLQARVERPEYQERLAQLGSVLDEAMGLKRRVVEALRPSLLDHFGLATALRVYVDSACAKAGVQADIRLPEDGGPIPQAPIPKEIAIVLFRIVQEGLDNIIRHANAKHVELELTTEGGEYAFTLRDDGCGFNPNDARDNWPHGIMGMQHRVRALGGRFSLESAVGQGTTLRVAVPAAQ
ncbi:MAG: sensor histidine kinase [Steroidobacteraceae bacterium]